MKLEWVVLLLMIVVSIAVTAMLFPVPLRSTVWQMSASAQTQPNQSIHLSYFGIRTEWRKLTGGSILEADFTVINAHSFPVKDITLSCSLSAPSGTVIGSKTITLYNTFPPHIPTPVKNINLGFIDQQVSMVVCNVISAVLERR